MPDKEIIYTQEMVIEPKLEDGEIQLCELRIGLLPLPLRVHAVVRTAGGEEAKNDEAFFNLAVRPAIEYALEVLLGGMKFVEQEYFMPEIEKMLREEETQKNGNQNLELEEN
jgi:hypothetical protein